MSVEIEGLEFQVEAKSDKGADGIDKLANSFKTVSYTHLTLPTKRIV